MKIFKLKTENKSEDNFSDLKTLDNRKLRKIKEKNIKFNIKRNNKIFDKLVNKNDKIDNEKTKKLSKKKKEKIINRMKKEK